MSNYNANLEHMVEMFEVKGTFYLKTKRSLDQFYQSIRSDDFICMRNGQQYKWSKGMAFIRQHENEEDDTFTIAIGIFLNDILGEAKHGKTLPEQLKYAESVVLTLVEKLGLSQMDDRNCWTMNRVSLGRRFCLKEDPKVLMKIINYHAGVKGTGGLGAKQTIRKDDCGYVCWGDEGSNSVLMGTKTESDYEVTYTTCFERRKLSLIEDRYWILRCGSLKEGFISKYLTALYEKLPEISQKQAEIDFGKYPWGTVDTVRNRLKELIKSGRVGIGQATCNTLERYFDTINSKELPDIRNDLLRMHRYEEDQLEMIFRWTKLNEAVIPDDILEPDERKQFPYSSLVELLQNKETKINADKQNQ